MRLTDEGRELVLAARRDVRQMEANLLGGLSPDAQNDLRDTLAAVLRRNRPSPPIDGARWAI
ncbi:hypothetical protein [Streptomyces sp. NPDC059489]|uniref:hypothetical protein n=1 Tax=Streptomyces sp. NPDC059489 TaxID=3346849 RepID=UPI003699243E